MTDVDYIDLLINTEKEEAQPGWKERMAHLTNQREIAVNMAQAKDPNFDPFAQYKKETNGWSKYIDKSFGAKVWSCVKGCVTV